MNEQLERARINHQFERLDKALLSRRLKKEDGSERYAKACEFMMMMASPDSAYIPFKHRDSRNYLYLTKSDEDREIFIPVTSEPFKRGTFDKCERNDYREVSR